MTWVYAIVVGRRATVADQNHTRRQRERQYEIDRITVQYADEYRAGRAPRIEDYVRRYPDYASELLRFAVYFHTVGFDMPALDASPAAELSPAAQRALAQIRDSQVTPAAAAAPLAGLVQQGITVGFTPRTLAETLRLTTDLLGKLEAHAIDAATIPSTLIKRLSAVLQVTPEAIAAYLGSPGQAPAAAFYYADRPPAQRQESFLDAVRASTLAPETKQEWVEIARQDVPGGGAPQP
jgi:hypothetical protein